MKTVLPDNSGNTESLAETDDIELIELNILEDDSNDKPVKAKRHNREVRRKIEEYLENKRLAMLTRDLLSED